MTGHAPRRKPSFHRGEAAPASEHHRDGFTLTELVVLIGILTVLMGLLLPAVQKVRQAAARAACASNCRQIALAVHQYESVATRLPIGCDYTSASAGRDVANDAGVSWLTSILPDVEQAPLAGQAEAAYRFDPTGASAEHRRIGSAVVPVYLCPTEARRVGTNGLGLEWGLTSYQGIAGTATLADDGVFHPGLKVRLNHITDGTTNTIMIGERPPGPDGYSAGWYSAKTYTRCQTCQILPAGSLGVLPSGACPSAPSFAPGQSDDLCSTGRFWSTHPGGANFAFCDGSVRFLTYSVAPILSALATRAGGGSVSPPE